MILVIWGVAFLVCIAPMLGWKDPEWEDRIFKNQVRYKLNRSNKQANKQ